MSIYDYYYDIKECRWKEWLDFEDIEHPITNSLQLSIPFNELVHYNNHLSTLGNFKKYIQFSHKVKEGQSILQGNYFNEEVAVRVP